MTSAELPDDIRVPLNELQADAKYLFGRVAENPACKEAMQDSVIVRLSSIETAARKLLSGLEAANTALSEAADYFERFSDADHDGERFDPNEEMKLLSICQRALVEIE
jgi:hypothetical protein